MVIQQDYIFCVKKYQLLSPEPNLTLQDLLTREN